MSSTWGKQLKYGEFEIVGATEGRPRLLGEGSFGKTFEAVRKESVGGSTITESVAIKVINPELLASKSKRFQFIQEVVALTKFQHSNLIHYIRCGEENGEVYYAMELCRGGDLVGLVRRYGPLSEKVTALIGLQVATGLREVHQRHRLVHRDIKPSNIMLSDELTPDLEAKNLAYRFEQQDSLCRVVDFGLVNFTLEASEAPQRFVGSPMYSSPEQICERPVDGRSDIYSLGMTLWYLLQGKGPLLDERGQEVKEMGAAMRRHTAPEEHDSAFPPNLSPEFRRILSRMVKKGPEKRVAGAAEAQHLLRDFLSGSSGEEAEEERFAVTQLHEPLDTVYELGERMSSRWAQASYAAKERKHGGREVKLSVVANVNPTTTDSGEVSEATARLGKLAELSRDRAIPEALVPVREVILTTDLLAYTEDMFPHIGLSDVLKARASMRRPIAFSESVTVLQPIAEAFDFLLGHGQDSVSLPCEEVWLTCPSLATMATDAQALSTPLSEWSGLQVRFSMMCVPPKNSDEDGSASSSTTVGETMSGSMQMTTGGGHPASVFARLVYRILNGSEVPAAVQYTPHAYVPAVTLGHASNNLIRDVLSSQNPPGDVGDMLKQLCANEGVVLRARSGPAVARVVSPGVVQSPFASTPQKLSADQWKAGSEIVCSESGRSILLPPDLPPWPGSSSSKAPSAQRFTGSSTAPPAVQRTVPPAIPKLAASSTAGGKSSPASGSHGTIGGVPIPVMSPHRSQASEEPLPARKRSPLPWVIGALVLFLGGTALAWKIVGPILAAHAEARADAAFAGNRAGETKVIGGSNFRWCPPTDATGFKMGSPPKEPGRQANEFQHQVVLSSGFWISENLVTQGEWKEVMKLSLAEQAEKVLDDDTITNFPAVGNVPARKETLREHLGIKKGETDKMMGIEDPKAPIYWVNWEEATEYCRTLNEREHKAGRLPKGWEIRLPSESQWEYACRAGTDTATYAGELVLLGKNNAPALDTICWYGGNCGVNYSGRGFYAGWGEKAHQFTLGGPRLVGEKASNPWGLCDALGNLSEWCQDWYAQQYPKGTVRDPAGPPAGEARVMRGNSWNGVASFCRAAARGWQTPHTRINALGFRPAVVRIAAQGTPVAAPSPDGATALDPVKEPPKEVEDPATRFAGKEAGDSFSIEQVTFHWCPPTGPAGFVMGSPPSEAGRSENEQQHTAVLTQGFWMAETLVTQGAWEEIMRTSLAQQAAKALADNTLYDLGGKKQTLRDYYAVRANDWSSVVGVEEADFPIYWVNWNEAVDFCRRVTERERAAGRLPIGWEARLPSEAQWEYACRAGTTTATYAGNLRIVSDYNAPLLDMIAWYGGNSGVGYTGKGWDGSEWPKKQYPFSTTGPRAVGRKPANKWGLRDMLGNLWEWTQDGASDYPSGLVTDPLVREGSNRMLRGGGWGSEASTCRAAHREGDPATIRYDDAGFRIAIVRTGD
ncbi:MAG TPA: SUMF1/EgtB/PvdO family nonheme iron enzyme [Chthoniobacteraceae bacterium]